jgi:tetratricopeptide (TPR) repeat protein
MPGIDVTRIRGLRQEGQDALVRGDRLRAELCFSRAIGLIEDIDEPQARRNEYAAIGFILARSALPYLAVQVAREALALDRQLGNNVGALIADMLTYGTALGHLEQTSEAADVFQKLLDLCLEHRRYGDAASASTNLGAILCKLGDTEKARQHFKKSLEYLQEEEFPETEILTRINLLGLYEHLNEDPKTSLEFARETLDRFPESTLGGYRALIDERIGTAAVSYLRSHRSAAAKRWLRQLFPALEVPAQAARRGK